MIDREKKIAEEMNRLESLTGIKFVRSNWGRTPSIRMEGYTVSSIRAGNLDQLYSNIRNTNDLIETALKRGTK